MDTAIHLMLHKRSQVLILIGSLFSQVTPNSMATSNRQVLKQTVSTFITNWTVMGMAHHEPLDHLFAKIDRFFVGRGYHHAILCFRHTTHLHPFDRALQKLNRTHTAGADRSQTGMITETGDDNTQAGCRFNDLHPFWNIYFITIDLQLGHNLLKKMQSSNFKVQMNE
jgi:hypothetical protein